MATAAIDQLTLPKSTPLPSPVLSVPPTPGTSTSTSTAYSLNGKKKTYKPDEALRPDIAECRMALQLFLESRMLESEQLLKEGDPKFERLYIATGYGLIQSVKAFMSFEDKVCSYLCSSYRIDLLTWSLGSICRDRAHEARRQSRPETSETRVIHQ
jgi:hypothetical protein